MAQHDLNIANQSFPSFRSDLNNALSAIQTTHSGTSRPTSAVAGQLWLDTTTATSPTLKYYDGADDISLATIDHVSNTVNWLDSTVSVTGLSTTATGTVLTLTDTATTSSVNLIIDNQKEIRFNETTANGTNYIGLKAPASLASNTTFVLPSADGTAGQFLKTDGAGNLSFSSDLPTTSFTGATVETSIADSDLVLIYDDSATAVRKMTKANLIAGVGGTNTPAFLAYRTSAQSLTTNTDTKVQWNTEDFDIGSCYDNVTNYRFTPNVAGKYVITHCLTVNNSSGVNVDVIFVEIHKNGSSAYPSIYRQGLNSITTSNDFNEMSFCVTKIFDMNGTTDYVEAFVHAVGTNLQTDASSNEVGFFSGYKLLT